MCTDVHRCIGDIEHQFKLMYANTLQEETGLLYHGYDYSHTASWANADRGHSPEVWDRALGWYMMALVDVLEIYPKDNSVFLEQFQTLAPRVVAAADKDSGVWWLVMSQPGREGNYFESSAAAMFVYSILKGVRLGFLNDLDGSLVVGAKKAYQYIIDNWVVAKSDGTFDWLNTVEASDSFSHYANVLNVLIHF